MTKKERKAFKALVTAAEAVLNAKEVSESHKAQRKLLEAVTAAKAVRG